VKRYLALFAITLVVALALAALARRPRTPALAPAAAPVPEVTLALAIEHGAMAPSRAAVPKDHRIRLEVLNRDAVTVTLSLAGYEDRLAPRALARGARWDTTFIADRPGEDFAWLLDGKPAGQLTVSGSHLVEGHR
jgi:hypothetical protein